MARVVRAPRASIDLDDIWFHIAQDDPSAADRLIDRIVGKISLLIDHPGLGRARPEIASDARSLNEGDYLILYRLVGPDVEIVRVVHGARRLVELFGDDQEK